MAQLSIDHARINAAIAQAETATCGEITCVVKTRALDYGETPLGWAAVLSLSVPLLFAGLGLLPHGWIEAVSGQLFGWHGVAVTGDLMSWEIALSYAVVQVVVFVATYGLIRFTALRLWLTPPATRKARAHTKAMEQFYARGLHKTAGRTGVMIFCALEEHYVEVIADEGIYARVEASVWDEAVNILIRNIKAGDITHGFEESIAVCGAVLAQHFPPGASNPNELPDVLIEI